MLRGRGRPFKKGHIPWNKDKIGVYSEEALRKMSTSRLGQTSWNKGIPCREETKRKISESMKGRKNPRPKKGFYKKCEICQSEFYVTDSKASQRFCSQKCQGMSQRGKPRKLSTRIKISKARKGIIFSKEHRRNMSLARNKLLESGWHPWNYGQKCPQISINNKLLGLMPPEATRFKPGSAHPSWKGGVSSERTKIYNSVEYKDWRKRVFERDNYICQECGATNGLGKTVFLQAHHIKSFAKYPKLRFKVDNGITLCFDCHNLTKKGRYT